MREKFPDLSRRLYLRPEVHVRVDEGRSFLRRSAEKWDVIQVDGVGSEYLYTREAFGDYLGHLTSRGIVSVTSAPLRLCAWGVLTRR